MPMFRTTKYHAHLKMVKHRGVKTCAMCYDNLKIVDVFRKVDENNIFGLMVMEGVDPGCMLRLTRVTTAEPPFLQAAPSGDEAQRFV